MKFNRLLRFSLYGGLLLLITIGCLRIFKNNPKAAQSGEAQLLAYRVLEDDRGSNLTIGVECPIDQANLKATLMKAASDHQADANRDYLLSKYLHIKAYIVLNDAVSSVPAGIIERYVPPRNPRANEDLGIEATRDEFEFKIREATESLKAKYGEVCAK